MCCFEVYIFKTFPTDVYLSLNGGVIPNHGYLDISDIGSTDTTALLCNTNRPPPPGSTISGGDCLYQTEREYLMRVFQDSTETEAPW